jgi:Tol biopolymer transport system component/DNA-binding winged helix-turn-helix (wHTH) protein
MMESEQLHYRFGGIDIDLSNLRVTVNGEVRTLEPKSFRLLQFLIENRGRAVPKDEMLSAVWTDTAVTDNALTRAVAQIRKALDDDPKEPRYVETIPTVGYRFLPQCEVTSAIDEAPNAAGRQTSRAWGAVAVAISLLGGGWLLARLSSVPRTTATFVSTAQLTSSHGLDIDAAWSPEGSLVAYASDVSGQFEIYVRSRDAAARTLQLTNDGNQNLTPSFSPDGRFVAYSCMAKPGIYRIPALGGSGQRLTDFGSQPKWSPDGQWIAFISNAKPSLSTTDYYFGANSALWLVSAAGGAAKQLTSETFDGAQTFPSWSSDSREIRFVNYIGQTPSVWTYRMADGRLEKRFEGPSGTTFGDAVFSRDSLRMYYVKSDLNGDIEIWMQPLGRETLRPSKDAEPLFRPTLGVPRGLSLSPDGKRLAFTATLAESKVLMRKVTNGSFDDAPATEVTHETTYRYALPHWSPDGQSVIYTKFEKGQLARGPVARVMADKERVPAMITLVSVGDS